MNDQKQTMDKKEYFPVLQDPDFEFGYNNVKQGRSRSFDEALLLTGFGKYNIGILVTSCLLVLFMCVDIFGFSVVLPPAACDLDLTTKQQGLLTAVPLIGIMISSFWWGFCADTLGRRKALLISMPIAIVFNLAAGLAPNYASLVVTKFLSACFSSSTNAAAYVWCGESTPARLRGRFMFLMAGTTMLGQLVIGTFALPIFLLTFRIPIPGLSMEYRPWRLLMQVNTLPGILGFIGLLFLHESPKFLLNKGRQQQTLDVLRSIYASNTGSRKEEFTVESVSLDDDFVSANTDTSFLKKLWNQTVPLFKPPLLKNSLKLYYLMFTAYMVMTGYTMWVPTMTNAYFDGNNHYGETFCGVASGAASLNITKTEDCALKTTTLYAVMSYSAACGLVNLLLSMIVGPLGKKRTTLLVYIVASASGILLLFIKIPFLSIVLFCLFLYVGLILGNINTYLMELNPTHLRGMATCLSVVVARGSGFFSVQMIGILLKDHCTPTFVAYIVLVLSGLLVVFTLPPETTKKKNEEEKTTKLIHMQEIDKTKEIT